jgi:anti-sigma factor RsiW
MRWHATHGAQHVDKSLADYALGGLAAEERAEVEAHLGACPRCVTKLAATVDAFALLAENVAEVEPAPRLRSRLLDTIALEPLPIRSAS